MASLAQVTDPPRLLPPAVSLIRSATTPTDDTGGRWALQGVRFLPRAAAAASVDDSCGATAGTFTYSRPGTVEWTSYVVQAYDQCSTLGSFARDYRARAADMLEAATPKAVEREFWTGTLAQAKTWPNLYLQKASTVTDITPVAGTPVSMAKAMSLLEQGIADNGFGGQAVIHMPRGLAVSLQSALNDYVRRDGFLLRTLVDTLVVPGVGYTGHGPIGNAHETPAAGSTWMYATGLVEYRETAGVLLPDWPEGDRGQVPAAAINRDTNTVTLWAYRTAMAYWDGQLHLAVLVNLPT